MKLLVLITIAPIFAYCSSSSSSGSTEVFETEPIESLKIEPFDQSTTQEAKLLAITGDAEVTARILACEMDIEDHVWNRAIKDPITAKLLREEILEIDRLQSKHFCLYVKWAIQYCHLYKTGFSVIKRGIESGLSQYLGWDGMLPQWFWRSRHMYKRMDYLLDHRSEGFVAEASAVKLLKESQRVVTVSHEMKAALNGYTLRCGSIKKCIAFLLRFEFDNLGVGELEAGFHPDLPMAHRVQLKRLFRARRVYRFQDTFEQHSIAHANCAVLTEAAQYLPNGDPKDIVAQKIESLAKENRLAGPMLPDGYPEFLRHRLDSCAVFLSLLAKVEKLGKLDVETVDQFVVKDLQNPKTLAYYLPYDVSGAVHPIEHLPSLKKWNPKCSSLRSCQMDVVSFVTDLVENAGKSQLGKLNEVIFNIAQDFRSKQVTGDKWKESINQKLKEQFDQFEQERLDALKEAVHLAALLVPPRLVILPCLE